jgi:prepilin peptidase CpaA
VKSEAALLLWLAFVTTQDLRKRRVPNWLVLTGGVLAAAVLIAGIQPFGIRWPDALLGAAVGFGGLLVFYAFRLRGAGDVKFAGALGLWTGLHPLFPIWAAASLLAALHGVLWLILQRWPWFPRIAILLSGKQPPDIEEQEGGGATRKRARHIPYAAYLALATVGWMVWGRQL